MIVKNVKTKETEEPKQRKEWSTKSVAIGIFAALAFGVVVGIILKISLFTPANQENWGLVQAFCIPPGVLIALVGGYFVARIVRDDYS